MISTKKGAARLLLGVVIGLIIIKGIVSWITGSISVMAQAADSFLDLLSAMITLAAVRAADKQADEGHPYGHGKLEDFAGLAQGILIVIAAGTIIYSSIIRIIDGAVVTMSEVGIVVMLVSIIASFLLSRHLRKVARATNSIALEASANNINADIYSALAVLVGLIILRITGLAIIDPIIAIGVALYILKVGYDTVRKPFSKLIDAKMPEEKEQFVKDTIMKYKDEVVEYHRLRTRQAGDKYYIDLHIVMRKSIPLEKCHEICDKIEVEVEQGMPGSSIIIHAEPCDGNCKDCEASCPERED
jgi:cation diffusion facilitator family transporter